jgi:hypothetical protein
MSAQAIANAVTGGNAQLPLPSAQALLTAAKLAQENDKPILLDYYADSVLKKAFIGIDKDTNDKILVKSRDEFTSLIKRIVKGGDDFLVMTENSIYIVTGIIEKKHIQATKMLAEAEDDF